MMNPASTREYWAKVVVSLHEPLESDDPTDDEPLVGYSRLFGVRATSERVRSLLDAEIDNGVIDWSETTWQEVDPKALDEDIRKRVIPIAGEGIWYRSGRIFFPRQSQ